MTMSINGSTGLTFPDASEQASGKQAVKAWVNFNGTGTVAIRESYNVSSITDNGTGDYTVNFTNAMPDVNYSISPMCKEFDTTANSTAIMLLKGQTIANTFLVGGVRLFCSVYSNISATGVDMAVVTVAIFR